MNRLGHSTSPYLLQHAENPVDWYEWGEEAFAEALRRNVPIFLSVGYSACHWCHVMAHESFEDPVTAGVMNELFVNVKVDREERPDVDSIYMDATQAMTRRGGWPMSVWMTPEGMPFYAGTYFPPEPRHGMPSFLDVCRSVDEAWRDRRHDLLEQATRLTGAINRSIPPAESSMTETDLAAAFESIRSAYDPRHGGFGTAPKFPQAPVLHFLLHIQDKSWGGGARDMLHRTLDEMAEGGLRDHVGGGFARYSVDDRWEIPHFEKMLYDNAQLASLYLRSWWSGGPDRHRVWAVETIEYVLRDLTLPDGGFASAEDADSEGEEGLFYTWSHEEYHDVLGAHAPILAELSGVTPEGNFEGRTHLQLVERFGTVAERHGITVDELSRIVEEGRRALFDARQTRVRPGLDDKVVTAWNGLMVRALAEAYQALGDERFLEAALTNARFVLAELTDAETGLLRRSWAKGTQGPPGVLADQASYVLGLLSLYEATGEVEWFDEALRLLRRVPDVFIAGDRVFSSTDHNLVARPQDLSDNPEPSGASLAHEAFLRVGMLTNDPQWFEWATVVERGSGPLATRAPMAVGHLLGSLAADGREVAIIGPNAEALRATYRARYRPGSVLAWSEAPTSHPPLLADRAASEAMAWVCRGFTCELPTADPATLEAQLS